MSDSPQLAVDRAPTTLETEQRLSRSRLFQLQRAFYHQRGVDAWRSNTVPHYVTNNPRFAHACAETLLGFLRDCRALPDHDPAEPVTLIELGAGSGRFAFLVLRSLIALCAEAPEAALRFRYVMTDFTETNIAFWREHEALAPFVAQGLLDFAVFDAEHSTSLKLVCADRSLSPGSSRNPVAAIANYVFDSIPQDVFCFHEGALYECLVSLSSMDSEGVNPSIERLSVTYTRRPASLDYYGEPALDALLRGYADAVQDAVVLLPSAAIRSIERLAKLSDGRLFLLSSDRGGIDLQDVLEPQEPALTVHGSFSTLVNFHALAEHVRSRSGVVLRARSAPAHLNVVGFLLGAHPSAWSETRYAYQRALGDGGPEDFFVLRRGLQGNYEALALNELLALLRMSRCDPRVLRDCLSALWKRVEEGVGHSREALLDVLLRSWEQHYSIGEEEDLAFELALLAHALQGFALALRFFDASEKHHGPDARTRWNKGLCHYAMGAIEQALRCFSEARALDASFVPERSVQVKGLL